MLTIFVQIFAAVTSPSVLIVAAIFWALLANSSVEEGASLILRVSRVVLAACLGAAVLCVLPELSTHFHPFAPESFNPDFDPWQEIQGTNYEQYWSYFIGANSTKDMQVVKSYLNSRLDDCHVLVLSAGIFSFGPNEYGLLSACAKQSALVRFFALIMLLTIPKWVYDWAQNRNRKA